MSENSDQKPAAEAQTAAGPTPSKPDAEIYAEQAKGHEAPQAEATEPAPNAESAARQGSEPSAEEQLASAQALLLAAQQQMHYAQQRFQAAKTAVENKNRELENKNRELFEQTQRLTDAPQTLLAAPDNNDASQGSQPGTGRSGRFSTVGLTPSSGDTEAAPETAMAYPPEESPQEAQPGQEAPKSASAGFLNGIYSGLANLGPIALLLVLTCMAWPIFLDPTQAAFCPGELKSLTAYLHSLATDSWFSPLGLGDGKFTLAQWPLFTWCLGCLALIPQLAGADLLLPVASFGCTFLAAFAVWFLAISAGFGRRSALAAGLILLCAPLFAPLPHFVGPAALAAAMMLLALACFCRGWMASRSWICLPLAFVFTALAGLAGGLLPFAVPLIASLLFLIWRGDGKRPQHLDALFGFILMLAIGGAWLAAIILGDDKSDYLNLLFAEAFQFAWPIHLLWLKPVAAGLLGLLPWLLIIFGVSWLRVLAHSAKTLGASRKENGSALVWLSLIAAVIIAVFVPWFHPAAVAICCLAAVLLGKAFVNLSNVGNRFFFLLASIILILAGALVTSLTYPETQHVILGNLPFSPPLPDFGGKLLTLSALRVLGGIAVAGGLVALLFVRRFMACGGLVFAALLVIALSLAARLLLVPELKAMPGTPLVSYAAIEEQVLKAVKPAQQVESPKAIPAEPVNEPVTPAQASDAPEPEEKAAGAAPAVAAPEGAAENAASESKSEAADSAPAKDNGETPPVDAASASPEAPAEVTSSEPSEAKAQ